MQTIHWEVQYLSPPKTIRYCKKCGTKAEYRSSELFRVNAQQKSLDIWLIYRCIHCKTTWNLTIYSRVNTKSLDPDLLNRFTNNDSELALSYAMDVELLKRSGADTEPPPYCVVGDPIDFSKDVRLSILSKHSAKIRLAKLLREKLQLSKSTFDQMVSDGIIRLENHGDIQKCKLQGDTVVLISSIHQAKHLQVGG